jgi:hypothetical protein|tara:strand:- start:77 stop:694 length:618 start_codon:yes stop_codon:yes gene_type:complete
MITIKHTFLATVILDGCILPNRWDIKIDLLSDGKGSGTDISIACERVNVYVETMLDNCMLVGPQSMEDILSEGTMFYAGIHPLIDDPYDHILAISLYTKLNAILEGVLLVDSVWIESYQGNGISHTHSSEDDDGNVLDKIVDPKWKKYAEYWKSKDPSFYKSEKGEVELLKQTWDEVKLGYTKDKKKSKDGIVREFTVIEGDKEK